MNHERHERHERPYRLSVRSPLSERAEAVITRVIGCAIDVHKALGPGFLESIYKQAMYIEMSACGLSFEREKSLEVTYRGVPLRGQRADLIVEGEIVVELKAVTRLDDVHRAQVLSYLKAARLRGGLLINFHAPVLPKGLKRIVL